MATPRGESYSAPSGATMRGGFVLPPAPPPGGAITNITKTGTDAYAPMARAHPPVVILHESNGNPSTFGDKWAGDLTGGLEYLTWTSTAWSCQGFNIDNYTVLKPWDNQGGLRQSFWLGHTHAAVDGSPRVLVKRTERMLDRLIDWLPTAYPQLQMSKLSLGGGSMGAWGTLTYGARRANKIAAMFPSRPRFRYSGTTAGNFTVPDWVDGAVIYPSNAGPVLSAIDGGGSAFDYMNIIAYVSNTANTFPFIAWCIGRNDGYMPFQDHIDMVAALRATKRPFAFVWNNGDHSSGDLMQSQILASYKYGDFDVNVGCPLYTNNSGDQDPSVDLVGGINRGFRHRNVVETATSWSCQITNILGARTVTVEPALSKVFLATVTPQVVNIPAANTWVTVTFNV